MTYRLEITIPGLPKMANQQLRGSWRAKHGHAVLWKRKVWKYVWHLRPETPLEKAKITITRGSSMEADFDGLVSGGKHLIDGLVEAAVIINDKPSCIGQPCYHWERAARGKGFVRILVEST